MAAARPADAPPLTSEACDPDGLIAEAQWEAFHEGVRAWWLVVPPVPEERGPHGWTYAGEEDLARARGDADAEGEGEEDEASGDEDEGDGEEDEARAEAPPEPRSDADHGAEPGPRRGDGGPRVRSLY